MFPAFKPLPKVHDCTLLLTRNGRAPYLVECVAEIVAASVKMHSQHVYEVHPRKDKRGVDPFSFLTD
jgi:hypothetical protein